mgnify:FL=1
MSNTASSQALYRQHKTMGLSSFSILLHHVSMYIKWILSKSFSKSFCSSSSPFFIRVSLQPFTRVSTIKNNLGILINTPVSCKDLIIFSFISLLSLLYFPYYNLMINSLIANIHNTWSTMYKLKPKTSVNVLYHPLSSKSIFPDTLAKLNVIPHPTQINILNPLYQHFKIFKVGIRIINFSKVLILSLIHI